MNAASITGFDYIILAILGLSTLFAFFKGFIRTSLSIIGWIVALVISYSILPYVKPMLAPYIHNELLLKISGPSIVFFVVSFIIAIINYQLVLLASPIRGGIIDKSLGILLGLARGAFFACALFSIIVMMSVTLNLTKGASGDENSQNLTLVPDFVSKSQSYPLLKSGSEMMMAALPASLNDQLAKLMTRNQTSVASEVNQPNTAPNQMQVIGKLLTVLPKSALTGTNLPTTSTADQQYSPQQVRQLLNAYNNAVQNGTISSGQLLSADQLQMLNNILNGQQQNNSSQANGNGYDNKENNDLNRLIKTVQ